MAIDGSLTWGQATATVAVGETVTVPVNSTVPPTNALSFSPVAEIASSTQSQVVLRGIAAGTKTIATGTSWIEVDTPATVDITTTNAFTLTVTAPVDDDSFLNKRGLTHFWENIDDLKQDKLTAGTNISISNNTISSSQPVATANSLGVVQVGSGLTISSGGVLSATGGGVADSVAWGHITGTMSDQTDLTTALGTKANTADLATVATSGSYNDLLNKPTIPAAQVNSDWDAVSGVAEILNKPTLATVATSGSYSDLSNKPTIGNATLTIQKNGTSAGTFTANATSNKSINITVPTTAADVSALPASTKYGASITVSVNTTDYKVTTTLKDQDGNTLGTAQVIDLPLESVVVNGSYDSTNKKIVLTLQNGNTIDIPVADLVAGLQSEITAQNMLDADLVDDSTSTHKFVTAAQITKLNGIATGAEVNQNAFSNVKVGSTTVAADSKTDTLELVAGSNVTLTPDATNDKVTIAATDTTYSDATTSASGLMSASDKTKLNGIASGAEVNVQADWTEASSSSDAYIKNKPTLATVATSGSYNDLSNKPTIPTVNNAILTITQNGTSAGTFTANASSNKTIALTDTTYSDATTSASGLMSSTDKTKLDGIASGAEVNVQANWTQTTTTADDYIKNKPTLATVATSGSYNDLSNKPTIPTVNNATLTIQKNGTNVQTFTANQSTNATANITVPTATSDLTNDGEDGSGAYVDELVIHATNLDATNGTFTSDKTFDEVKTAYESGKNIVLYVTVPDSGYSNDYIIPLDNVYEDTSYDEYTFYFNFSIANTVSANAPLVGGVSNMYIGFYISRFGSSPSNYEYYYGYYRRRDAIISVTGSLATRPTKNTWVPNAQCVYDALANKANSSDIPTVNNATLTIQKNGTNVQTFTANASSNKTANITVPTATSDLTNDSNFVSTSDTGTVSTDMLANSAVTTAKINDSAVTNAKLATAAVQTTNILDAAVTASKIDFTTMPFATAYTDTKTDNFSGLVPYSAFTQNNGFTISNNGLVCPKTGYYLISARLSGYGTGGWLRIHVSSNTSTITNDTIVASAIDRRANGTYHTVSVTPTIAYVAQGQYIYARQTDAGVDLNSGMDAGIEATVLTAVFIGG